ncbi:conserved hypothetical protein [Neospora caninum Liverpool]|uniref:Sec16 Sec23-binding domain-containing protein n=1 Tax=Neospora caninum (strain Liverpool) TaxID=572307 RepID=F0V7I3_NEOCL|nr:conserved hypothetical protein [Neospora caninum Liverpool]CBZ49674.1 conserved hypothetical protein [Neospora caninum Liverpool]CEL64257.1 TPA: hypothetical protein BN1204_001620 [Neospora caninum Liverpool]|eukprot:XP_003879709.1 conserved hypothetical protein [Neospora caninum Liverpool]
MSVSNLFSSDPARADDDWLRSTPRKTFPSSSKSTASPAFPSSFSPQASEACNPSSVTPPATAPPPVAPSYPVPFQMANPFASGAFSPAPVSSSGSLPPPALLQAPPNGVASFSPAETPPNEISGSGADRLPDPVDGSHCEERVEPPPALTTGTGHGGDEDSGEKPLANRDSLPSAGAVVSAAQAPGVCTPGDKSVPRPSPDTYPSVPTAINAGNIPNGVPAHPEPQTEAPVQKESDYGGGPPPFKNPFSAPLNVGEEKPGASPFSPPPFTSPPSASPPPLPFSSPPPFSPSSLSASRPVEPFPVFRNPFSSGAAFAPSVDSSPPRGTETVPPPPGPFPPLHSSLHAPGAAETSPPVDRSLAPGPPPAAELVSERSAAPLFAGEGREDAGGACSQTGDAVLSSVPKPAETPEASGGAFLGDEGVAGDQVSALPAAECVPSNAAAEEACLRANQTVEAVERPEAVREEPVDRQSSPSLSVLPAEGPSTGATQEGSGAPGSAENAPEDSASRPHREEAEQGLFAEPKALAATAEGEAPSSSVSSSPACSLSVPVSEAPRGPGENGPGAAMAFPAAAPLGGELDAPSDKRTVDGPFAPRDSDVPRHPSGSAYTPSLPDHGHSPADVLFGLGGVPASFCPSDAEEEQFARASSGVATEGGQFAPAFRARRDAEQAARGDPLFLFRDDDASDSVFNSAAACEILGTIARSPLAPAPEARAVETEQAAAAREGEEAGPAVRSEAAFSSSAKVQDETGTAVSSKETEEQGVEFSCGGEDGEQRNGIIEANGAKSAPGSTPNLLPGSGAPTGVQHGLCPSSFLSAAAPSAGDSAATGDTSGSGDRREGQTVPRFHDRVGEARPERAADLGALQGLQRGPEAQDFSSLLQNPFSSTAASPPEAPSQGSGDGAQSAVAGASGPSQQPTAAGAFAQPSAPPFGGRDEEQPRAPSLPRADIPAPPPPAAPPAWLRAPPSLGPKETRAPAFEETARQRAPWEAQPVPSAPEPSAPLAEGAQARPKPRPESQSPLTGYSRASASTLPEPQVPTGSALPLTAAPLGPQGETACAQRRVGSRGVSVAFALGGYMFLGSPENSAVSELPLTAALGGAAAPGQPLELLAATQGTALGDPGASLFLETVAGFPGPLGAADARTTASLIRYFERIVEAKMRLASQSAAASPSLSPGSSCRNGIGAPGPAGCAGSRIEVCGLWAFLLALLQQEQRSQTGHPGTQKASSRLTLPSASALFPPEDLCASVHAAESRAPEPAAPLSGRARDGREATGGDAVDEICRRACMGDVRGGFEVALEKKIFDHAFALGNALSSDAVNETLRAFSAQLASDEERPVARGETAGTEKEEGAPSKAREVTRRWRRAVANLYSVVGQATDSFALDSDAIHAWYPTAALVARFAGLVHPSAQRLLLALSRALSESEGSSVSSPCEWRHASQLCALLAGKTVIPAALSAPVHHGMGTGSDPRHPREDGSLLFIGGYPVEQVILTETLEYLHRLHDPQFMFPQLVPSKIWYALFLADLGLLQQAQSYCTMAASFLRALPQIQVPAEVRQDLRAVQQKIEGLIQTGKFARLNSHLVASHRSALAAPEHAGLSTPRPASAGWDPSLFKGSPQGEREKKEEGGLSLAAVVGGSWLEGMIGGLKKALSAEERNVGVENAYYYDHVQKRWRERGREHEEEPLPADPTGPSSGAGTCASAPSPPPPPACGDMATRPRVGADRRNRYVDVFTAGSSSNRAQPAAPAGPVIAPTRFASVSAPDGTSRNPPESFRAAAPMPPAAGLLTNPFGVASPPQTPSEPVCAPGAERTSPDLAQPPDQSSATPFPPFPPAHSGPTPFVSSAPPSHGGAYPPGAGPSAPGSDSTTFTGFSAAHANGTSPFPPFSGSSGLGEGSAPSGTPSAPGGAFGPPQGFSGPAGLVSAPQQSVSPPAASPAHPTAGPVPAPHPTAPFSSPFPSGGPGAPTAPFPPPAGHVATAPFPTGGPAQPNPHGCPPGGVFNQGFPAGYPGPEPAPPGTPAFPAASPSPFCPPAYSGDSRAPLYSPQPQQTGGDGRQAGHGQSGGAFGGAHPTAVGEEGLRSGALGAGPAWGGGAGDGTGASRGRRDIVW